MLFNSSLIFFFLPFFLSFVKSFSPKSEKSLNQSLFLIPGQLSQIIHFIWSLLMPVGNVCLCLCLLSFSLRRPLAWALLPVKISYLFLKQLILVIVVAISQLYNSQLGEIWLWKVIFTKNNLNNLERSDNGELKYYWSDVRESFGKTRWKL